MLGKLPRHPALALVREEYRDHIADWHVARGPWEAPCGSRQWRKRDRTVINVEDMNNRHLHHAFRFTIHKPAHHSKYNVLLEEIERRRTHAVTIASARRAKQIVPTPLSLEDNLESM